MCFYQPIVLTLSCSSNDRIKIILRFLDEIAFCEDGCKLVYYTCTYIYLQDEVGLTY